MNSNRYGRQGLKHVPPLFEAVKRVKTETGLTWDVATSVRRVLTKEGKVTIATGQDSTYTELETPTKVHGLVGACFSRMWTEPSLAKHFPTYEEFNLVATTISTVYNEAAKNAGLLTRMCKFLPTARGTAPPKRMRIYHSKGDKDDPRLRHLLHNLLRPALKSHSSRKTRTRTANDIETQRSLSLTLTNLRGTGTCGGSRGAGKATGMTPSHGRDSKGNLWIFIGHN